MNTNYLDKLEFNKVKEMLENFASTYIGKNIILNLFPSNKKEIVESNLQETEEAVNLVYRNSCPFFYEIADITTHLKSLESNINLSAKSLLELATIFRLSQELKDYFNKEFLNNEDYPILSDLFYCLYSNKTIVDKMHLKLFFLLGNSKKS